MDFSFLSRSEKRKKADALVLPFWKGEKKGICASGLSVDFIPFLSAALETGDFKGKEGEVLCLYLQDQPEKRIVLLGLGDEQTISTESFRRSFGSLTKTCISRKWKSINLIVPETAIISTNSLSLGVAEGILLPNYSIAQFKSSDDEDSELPGLLEKVTWVGLHKSGIAIAEKTLKICEAVYYARDLVNGNADEVTPQFLEACARGLEKEFPKVKATLFNKKRIEKEKLDLLLAVNRGSALDPAFIILEYKGNPKAKQNIVIVGKAVTYDTGGLNIKTSGMETMKCDMGGGAVCFGVMLAIASLGLKANVTVVIPATENSVDAKSFKPGDVYTGYLGKSVEMTNSDAEGRLILADALAYAVENLNPTYLIDFATLTGAVEIILGSEATGLMSTDDKLAVHLMEAGERTSERLWRLPLYEEYKEKLKSDIADMKSWNGRSASSSVAATFLKEFTGNIPWAHCDIASTAYLSEAKKYLPKYATGVGIRMMVDFIEHVFHV